MPSTRQRKAPVKKRAAAKKPTARRRVSKRLAAEASVLPGGVFISKTAPAKVILAAIDAWALSAAFSTEPGKLWNILSALRGPDEPDLFSKQRTTAIIRHHALPNLARASGADVNPVDSLDDAESHVGRNRYQHFARHIIAAVQALR